MANVRHYVADLKASPGLHLLVYFAAISAVFGLLAWVNPWFYDMLVPDYPNTGAASDFGSAFGSADEIRSVTIGGTLASALVALLGALAVNAPAVWIYMVIMRQEGYEKAFVRMLLVLPIVVAGVVQVVQGDLALAFALAGIVAAVRFRTTVKDLQNAVFAFAAIGVGLAAGTGSLVLAAVLAFMVSLLGYVMWKMNLGDVQPSLGLAHSGVLLSEALVPGETHRAVVIGHEKSVEPVHGDELDPLGETIERLADYVRSDALRKKKKYNTLLLVYTLDVDAAREIVKPILEKHTSRWVEVDVVEREDQDVVAIEYLLRLKKSVEVGTMIDRFGAGEDAVVKAIEMKPVKGLRDRLT